MAVTELKNRNTSVLDEVMPARAKYYDNDAALLSRARSSYDGFVVNRPGAAEKPAVDLSDIRTENEELRFDIEKGNPNILPSTATLRMLSDKYKAPEKPFESDDEVSYKINAKGKFIFAVYAVLVLSLVLVIVLNAIAANRQTLLNSALSGEIAEMSKQIETLSQTSDTLSDSSNIYNEAAKLGMTGKQATAVKVNFPQSLEVQPYQGQSNWFDRLCDLFN